LRLATFRPLGGFTNQKEERRLDNGLQPFVKLRCCEGRVYSWAAEFLREVEALKRALFSQRVRKVAPASPDRCSRSASCFVPGRFTPYLGEEVGVSSLLVIL
jgi:hypothetical protein